jgi:hypothetical protein
MGIEQRKQQYLQSTFGAIVIFAVLGAGALFIATHFLTQAVEDALKP